MNPAAWWRRKRSEFRIREAANEASGLLGGLIARANAALIEECKRRGVAVPENAEYQQLVNLLEADGADVERVLAGAFDEAA
jgi:hypothetical protein